jgi:phage terminase large subunit
MSLPNPPKQENIPIDKRRARALLWTKGILTWKLTEVQKELYHSFHNSTGKTIVWSCSRRLGKSYALCLLAIEKALQKPNSIIKYIAPTQKHVKMIITPIFRDILKDCPKELKPDFKTQDNVYRFPNGSEVQLAGTDSGRAEKLRGGSADICIVDEAAFVEDLEYIVQSVLIPTTTTTRGRIILSSTPPKAGNHPFVDYIQRAEAKGQYVKKTIYDALGKSHVTQDMINDLIEEYGSADSPEFRREYLCEIIRNEDSNVVPEFTDDLQKEIVKPWPRPPHFDIYVAGDIGFKDLTVFLFAYYDFRQAKIVIEDELVMSGRKMTTEALANAIREKEASLFSDKQSGEVKKPYLRVCDNNLIVINDLYVLHQLSFTPTAKDDSEAALNNMKIMLKQKKIVVNPRCETLLRHLKYATWDKTGRKMARSQDNGHFDAVDALKYLVRNVQLNKNPYPSSFGLGSYETTFYPESPNDVPTNLQPLANIFKLRRSIRS